MKLVIHVDNLRAVGTIDGVVRRLSDFGPVWPEVRWELLEMEKRHFRTRGGGKWRITRRTIRRKGKPTPLVRSGRLKDTLTTVGHPDQVFRPTPRTLTFGASKSQPAARFQADQGLFPSKATIRRRIVPTLQDHVSGRLR